MLYRMVSKYNNVLHFYFACAYLEACVSETRYMKIEQFILKYGHLSIASDGFYSNIKSSLVDLLLSVVIPGFPSAPYEGPRLPVTHLE